MSYPGARLPRLSKDGLESMVVEQTDYYGVALCAVDAVPVTDFVSTLLSNIVGSVVIERD
jgi:hypothetical protein